MDLCASNVSGKLARTHSHPTCSHTQVYRSRADGTLAAMRAAQRDKLKVGRQGRG